MNRQRESRGGRVVVATGTGRLSPSQQPRGFLARLRFRFRVPAVLAGFARNGLIVALGFGCASVLLLAAAPKKKAVPKPNPRQPRLVVPVDPALRVPDAAWRRVPMTPAQKERFRPLEARLQHDQRLMLRGIGPKGDVLRRELQIASATPGQGVRAAKLRQEIFRLTAPLQERHAEFVQEAKALLTPQQRRQLAVAGTQVKAAQAAARRASRAAATGGAR